MCFYITFDVNGTTDNIRRFVCVPASDDKHIIFGDSGSLLSEPEPYAFTSLTMKDFVFDYLRLLPQFPCVKRESDSVCVCVGVGVCVGVCQPVVCGVCDEI